MKKNDKTAGKRRAASLLLPGEPRPFCVRNPKGRGPGIVVCDHAARRVPRALAKTFGVSRADLQRHIGWDIGAADVSLHLSRKLDMPAVLAAYSRLVVDLNRDPARAGVIPASSWGTPVPGNRKLSAAARRRRLDSLFWPYHDAVGAQVDRFFGKGRVPLLLFIHSFTPVANGEKRPWHIGVMWKEEEKIARTIIRALRRHYPQYKVGANQPYDLGDAQFRETSFWRHAVRRGAPYVFVEFRQDLIDTPAKAARWGNIFIKALQPVLDDPATFRRRRARAGRGG